MNLNEPLLAVGVLALIAFAISKFKKFSARFEWNRKTGDLRMRLDVKPDETLWLDEDLRDKDLRRSDAICSSKKMPQKSAPQLPFDSSKPPQNSDISAND